MSQKMFQRPFRFFIPGYVRRCHQQVAHKVAWPHSYENDVLMRWRANILASILMAGLVIGIFAYAVAAVLIVNQNAWGLALVDTLGLGVCLVFLRARSIRYEIRAGISVLMIYMIGMAIILSIGFLSGGPAWLFAFAVIAGILMGNHGALGAILINAVSLGVIGWLMFTGRWGSELVFFSDFQTMAAAGVNFVFLNTLTAVAVATLVQGLSEQFRERQAAQKKLQENQALLALITGHTSALVSIHDSALRYVYASPSHRKLGYDPDDLVGRSGFTMVDPADRADLQTFFEESVTEKTTSTHLNYQLKDTSGNIHYYRGSFDAVYNLDGSLEKIICVGEEITEIRRIQKERIDALTLAAENQKLALVGQIAGKMAHDFNNVLGIIMGRAELAQIDCPHPPTRDALKIIFDQTVRGKNLTRNLVAFAKDQEPKQEYFKVPEKIDLIVDLLKQDLEGIDVICDYARNLPLLPADPGMIEHALVNLVQNAVHAVSLAPFPRIIIRVRQEKSWMIIEIEDNGCGIPADAVDRVFEPAFTLKGSEDLQGAYGPGIKGTGYGMANVKRYVRQHQGRVSLQSEPGKGTKVRIRLPIFRKLPARKEIVETGMDRVVTGKQILVLEDEPAISGVLSHVLTRPPCRHRVDIAENGRAALAFLARKSYDLISLDYLLPEKMNGMDIYRHIRQLHKTVPVLFISGNIQFLESIRSLQRQDPYLGYLPKPCMNMEYIRKVNQMLGAWTGKQEGSPGESGTTDTA